MTDSIITNIKKFMEDNPGEHICLKDIAANLGCELRDVKNVLFDMFYSNKYEISVDYKTMRFHGKNKDGSINNDE